MTIGILGKKVGMTQIFDHNGKMVPVTIIQAGPCQVTQLKKEEFCGYNAIQLGYFETPNPEKHLTKPERGHLKKYNLPYFRFLKEYKISKNFDISPISITDTIEVTSFKIGEKLNVSGYTIGKGNTGNIKLHNFNRGAMTHGSKHHRLQGSLGAGTSPGRVFPGKRMPRRSGHEKCTIKNLQIFDIFPDEHLLLLKGSVPGKSGNFLKIEKS